MASISEKELYNLNMSINKAINPMEAPLKMKHARSIIISTHRTREAKTFWSIIMQQSLMEYRFTAWKFCHLFHKVLREGHANAFRHSNPHKKVILEMGKLWGHLQDGVGPCIQAYSKLLLTKLDFHNKNAIFPGSLTIGFQEIEKFADNDISVYFQLAVDIFDYLDEIINVETAVLMSINMYHMSSMTPQGQCRLAPLITLIQDSNPLYDISVRVMFKLHDSLPSDILCGHRERFREIFFKLKQFYNNVRPLQYFVDLIQVPHLPDSAPDFNSKVDFGSYIPPVVLVQPDPEPELGQLVDANDSNDSKNSYEKSIELEKEVHDKEIEIQQLLNELQTRNEFIESIQNNYITEKQRLTNQISTLEEMLTSSEQRLTEIITTKSSLESELTKAASVMKKSTEDEEKIKLCEDKFTKLKTMYNQLRDEHIKLLRQHGETSKLLSKEKEVNIQLKTEIQDYENKIANITQNIGLEAHKTIEIDRKCKEAEIRIAELLDENNSKQMKIEEFHTKILQSEKELENFKDEICNLKKTLLEGTEALHKEQETFSNTTNEYEKIISDKSDEINKIKNQLNEIQEKLVVTEKQLEAKNISHAELLDINRTFENKVESVLDHNSKLELNIKSLNDEKNNLELMYKNNIQSLWDYILQTLENVNKLRSSDENIDVFHMIDGVEAAIDDFNREYYKYCENGNSFEILIEKIILMYCKFLMLQENCFLINTTSSDIEKGQGILEKIISINVSLAYFLKEAHKFSTNDIETYTAAMKKGLSELRSMMDALINLNNPSWADLLEKELNEMDKIIEDATEKILNMMTISKSTDSKFDIEVNEKIFDACTELLKNIQILVRKSKILQEEIVSLGQGNSTSKEFYNRNSQWTEGLISASKSIAKAANFLVEAANKALTTEPRNNFEIIVAAQEIAACTAQLVVSSRVKAKKQSLKLVDFIKASKNVSEATGALVATVKNCNQCLDNYNEQLDLTKLTASQAKTMEIEMNVKILELENSLQIERQRLLAFRRDCYQNAEERS